MRRVGRSSAGRVGCRRCVGFISRGVVSVTRRRRSSGALGRGRPVLRRRVPVSPVSAVESRSFPLPRIVHGRGIFVETNNGTWRVLRSEDNSHRRCHDDRPEAGGSVQRSSSVPFVPRKPGAIRYLPVPVIYRSHSETARSRSVSRNCSVVRSSSSPSAHSRMTPYRRTRSKRSSSPSR